jgi:hypothetical protein
MNADIWLSVILLVGWLVLVGSGIARRGQPIGKVALQGAIWIGIIGILWLVAAVVMHFRQ